MSTLSYTRSLERLLTVLPRLRLFERGECNYQDLFTGPVITYESNILFELRFMVDTGVSLPSEPQLAFNKLVVIGRRNELDRGPWWSL